MFEIPEITFFHKGTNLRVYAVYACFYKEFDEVTIEVFDFSGENYYLGIYDSDGGCIKGDELNIPDDIDENNIINTVFDKLKENQ